MLICIVSDTHNNGAVIQSALDDIKLIQPAFIVHCGDVTTAETLNLFCDFEIRLAFGNCDGQRESLVNTVLATGSQYYGETLSFEVEGRTFYVSHGHNQQLLQQAVDSQRYDYLFYGHSHQAQNIRAGKTRIINPGAFHAVRECSFATLDPVADLVEFYKV